MELKLKKTVQINSSIDSIITAQRTFTSHEISDGTYVPPPTEIPKEL